MTPTPEQIGAGDEEDLQALQEQYDAMWEDGWQKAIERCAQVADTFKFLPEYPKGVQAIVAITIAAAIRALKDKP